MTIASIVATNNSWNTFICTTREAIIAIKNDDCKGDYLELKMVPVPVDLNSRIEVIGAWEDGEMSDEAYYLAMYLLSSKGE